MPSQRVPHSTLRNTNNMAEYSLARLADLLNWDPDVRIIEYEIREEAGMSAAVIISVPNQ